MNAIDPNEPLELDDGTPVTLISEDATEAIVSVSAGHRLAGGPRVFRLIDGVRIIDGPLSPKLRNVASFQVGQRVISDTGHMGTVYRVGASVAVDFDLGTPTKVSLGNCFTLDGRQAYPDDGKASSIRPAAGLLDFSKPLQTRSGFPVTYKGALSGSGKFCHLVEINRGFNGKSLLMVDAKGFAEGRPANTILRREDADDIIPQVERVTVYRNVYADGTTGSSEHKSFNGARDRSKIGKTRIGILKLVKENGVAVSSDYTPALPYTRIRGAAASEFVAA